MNILTIEGRRLVRDLRALGCDVLDISGCDRAADVLLERPLYYKGLRALLDSRGFRPDAVIWMDQGNLPVVFGLEALDCVVLGYTIDDYCNPWHVPFSACFDAVFVAQRDYVPLFEAENLPRPARWTPLFCDHERDVDAGATRDIPVSFVGTLQPKNIPDRFPFLEAFKKRHPLYTRQGDYRPIFHRSRIVLNQSAIGELNYRVFEALGCGAACLTEQTDNGLDDIFTAGETILPPYPKGDVEAAAAAARFWLDRPEALAAIARAGRDLVRAEHTSRSRVSLLLEWAQLLARENAPARRLAIRQRAAVGVATAMAFIAAELLDPALARSRQTYENLAQGYTSLWSRL
ncbi:glycosyltransferase [Oceanidesulfovibrio marinus]|uniref:Glycosyltransferase family 1 protein n=1 Tax=Oceanidesulfovibrio marinus TaxID=370038 RepID=A0A6P1ZJK6_9BACT|nr:glycosyltransferase [Oceanidesulfovibrio marinus]QJT10091.1 glycosyltransferase family 1 protein [Oceanidesulfovibrio marinus]TVM35792.1 glycosyltransferase family 1 protein [Oceanidesulfovibrio marinus]